MTLENTINMESKKPKIKAILSDGGNILFDDTPFKNLLYDYYNQVKTYDIPKELFFDLFRPYKDLVQTTEEEYEDVFARMIEKNHLEIFEKEGENYSKYIISNYKHPEEPVKIQKKKVPLVYFDKVGETIYDLKKNNIDFIVLTDAPHTGKYYLNRLISSGLNITDIISSKDTGCRKPEPEFFQTALNKYSLKKEEVLFMAHDLDELEGAHKLGYKVIAFNYDRKDDLSFIPDNFKIDKFEDLAKIVYEINKKQS